MSSHKNNSVQKKEASRNTEDQDTTTNRLDDAHDMNSETHPTLVQSEEESQTSGTSDTATNAATQSSTHHDFRLPPPLQVETSERRPRCRGPMCHQYVAVNGAMCNKCGKLRYDATKNNILYNEANQNEMEIVESNSDTHDNNISLDDLSHTLDCTEYSPYVEINDIKGLHNSNMSNIGSILDERLEISSAKTANKPKSPGQKTITVIEKEEPVRFSFAQANTNELEAEDDYFNPVNNERPDQNELTNYNQEHKSKIDKQGNSDATSITEAEVPVYETNNDSSLTRHNDHLNAASLALNEVLSHSFDVERQGDANLRTRHVSLSDEPATTFIGQTFVRHIHGEELDNTRLDNNEYTPLLASSQISPNSPNSIANMRTQNQIENEIEAHDSPSALLSDPITVQAHRGSVLEFPRQNNRPYGIQSDTDDFEVTSVLYHYEYLDKHQ